MVLVHPDFRGRGIGRALLNHCVAYLRGRGIRCIKLDATPQGKLLYDRLGFQEEWPLTRWENPNVQIHQMKKGTEIRPYAHSDLAQISQLDTNVFCASRETLLETLSSESSSALVHASKDGIAGYGMLREGSRAHYLGPLVAACGSSATSLVGALLGSALGKLVFWDIPDGSVEAVSLADRKSVV